MDQDPHVMYKIKHMLSMLSLVLRPLGAYRPAVEPGTDRELWSHRRQLPISTFKASLHGNSLILVATWARELPETWAYSNSIGQSSANEGLQPTHRRPKLGSHQAA
ncbi:MAG: hypothetical protein ETSY2_17980 [Candidatus Entotheonella gemina]|uniref:Uncharacterized protein n=1 Tax=Candidatus Entotheonella gemina TaxID=1429439 RepID=W4M7Z1_9BACT|nr:MAG: hypothetical protein ETSY2_17980 [Candidatus Entotheonella gemina]